MRKRNEDGIVLSHTGTAHGQWLDDMAAQIQEEERLMRENERVEEYFSFDKLGSSLPLYYRERVSEVTDLFCLIKKFHSAGTCTKRRASSTAHVSLTISS